MSGYDTINNNEFNRLKPVTHESPTEDTGKLCDGSYTNPKRTKENYKRVKDHGVL